MVELYGEFNLQIQSNSYLLILNGSFKKKVINCFDEKKLLTFAHK